MAQKIVLAHKIDKFKLHETFALPCITQIRKVDDKPIFDLNTAHTEGRPFANIGEYICQFTNGKWQVFGTEAYKRVTKD